MSVALQKKSRVTGGWDRDLALERLFALPVPPAPRASRAYPIHTPLGRIMRLRGWMILDVVAKGKVIKSRAPGVHVPDDRVMTELLAGRMGVETYRAALGEILGVDARVL